MQFLVVLVSSEGTSSVHVRATAEAARAKYMELYKQETAVETDDSPVYLCTYRLKDGAEGFDVEMDSTQDSGVTVANGELLYDYQFGMDTDEKDIEEDEEEADEE